MRVNETDDNGQDRSRRNYCVFDRRKSSHIRDLNSVIGKTFVAQQKLISSSSITDITTTSSIAKKVVVTRAEQGSLRRVSTRLLVALLVGIAIASVSAQVVPGTNVNMVSGRTWPDGDPFLQKQDEGSIAVSSRNVLHLVGGANDYRTVDLPGLPTDKPTGDAWVGLFKSFDGGKTWKSTLIPGYPQDNSAAGLSSPLKGFSAAADPLVRAGSNGLFFYSAIAFQRAAIVGSTPVRAGIEDNNWKDATGSSRAVSRKRERERERARDQAREREREKIRERDRERERERKGVRASQRGKGKASNNDRKTEPRQQPDPRIRGGAEDDDEAAGVDGTASSVFVSTLIDLNNRENGDPISFVRTTLV